MDKINERIYEANIELVDRNKLLEEDLKKTQKRIDTAIEYIESFINYLPRGDKAIELLSILKGEEYGNNR